MGGMFGVVSKEDCALDLFFGVDYHSHLGTVKAGMTTLGKDGYHRVIHNIENSPFRTKFENDLNRLTGTSGIGCISDADSQPLVVRSRLGDYAITCVGKVNNAEALIQDFFKAGGTHLLEGSRGAVNTTELVAMIIDQCSSFVEGLQRVHQLIEGSMSVVLLTGDGNIIASRDRLGRTPIVIGRRDGAMCVASESFSYSKLDYRTVKELGPAEIVRVSADGYEVLSAAGKEMRICSFLWTYYGYPSSVYENVNVEAMRYRCGQALAKQDGPMQLDSVAGVPDTGLASAVGYANESGTPFSRPLIKYTPTWPRSFTPQDQRQRNLIAKMKIIPVHELIEGKDLLFIDDSIVRGTQLKETSGFLFDNGAKSVHIRPASPPVCYSCKYLNFTRSNSETELFARRTILELEGKCDNETTAIYTDASTDQYAAMVKRMGEIQHFSSLKFITLEDMTAAIGIPRENLCTYCWNGKE